MANFEFKLTPHVVLGNYSLARLGEQVAPFGSKFILVTEPVLKDIGLVEKLKKTLDSKNISVLIFDGIGQSPDSDIVERALTLARGAQIDGVIAFGGMTPCAIARAVAAFYKSKKSIYDYVEGLQADVEPLPLIQIPATCRDPFLFMKTSPIVDARSRAVRLLKLPEDFCKLVVFDSNTYAGIAPNTLTSMVFAGMGTAFEGYISTKSSFLSETILEKAIDLFLMTVNPKKEKLIASSKEELLAQAACLTSLGLAFSSPGVGTAISLTCGGRYKISNSLISTILLPHIMTDAIRSNLEKVVKVANMLDIDLTAGTDQIAIAQAGIMEIRRQLSTANLPTRMKDIDLTIESLVPVSEDASALSFMSYIPRPMSGSDVFELIKEAY